MSREECIMTELDRLWQETPQNIKSDYGTNYFHAFKERIFLLIQSARENTQEVIDSVVDAVTVREPQKRYKCCGPFTTVLWWLFEHLPIEIMDAFYNIASLIAVKPRALDND